MQEFENDDGTYNVDWLRAKLGGDIAASERKAIYEDLKLKRQRLAGCLVRTRHEMEEIDTALRNFAIEEKAARDAVRGQIEWLENLHQLEDNR